MKYITKCGRDYFIGKGAGQFKVCYCEKCKMAYTYPQLNEQELNKYYPDSYEAYVPKKNVLNILQICKYYSDIRLINANLKKAPDSIYEIGAGRGQFTAALRKKWKKAASVCGAEQSRTGVKNAYKEYGIKLECKSAENITFNENYDLIVMRHVLEHLNHFESVIQNIYQNGLKDGGLLFIKVPKLNSYEAKRFGRYWDGFDLPRHRTHFTDTGIKKLLSRYGFRDIKIYNEIVPSSYDRSMQYEKRRREYLSDSWKCFRYLFIWIRLQKHKKNAGRMIVTAIK